MLRVCHSLTGSLTQHCGKTTIRGYLRHFTAQWRESVAHASGHKYGEALTHINKSMHAYVNTYTQKWMYKNT